MKIFRWALLLIVVVSGSTFCMAEEKVNHVITTSREFNLSNYYLNRVVSFEVGANAEKIDSSWDNTEGNSVTSNGSNIARYGYDLVRDDSSRVNSFRLRGGVNRLSKDAQVGVQVIVNW